jgi:uncharacterized damage-inducible protein DinB
MRLIYKPTQKVSPFYQDYIDKVPDDGKLLQHLADIMVETEKLLAPLPAGKLSYRYAPGKWTIKDIIQHLSDCERVIIYRAMRMARRDAQNLPGFDENVFAENANAERRSIHDLLSELRVVRSASLCFIETLDDEALEGTGTANNYPLSARLLVNHVYAHHKHHLGIIKERYLSPTL